MGRAPVCEDCLAGLESWDDALLCAGCQQTVADAEGLDERGYCGACRREPPAFEFVRGIGPYEGSLRRLIHLLKYDGVRPVAETMGARLAAGAAELGDVDLIVPAPLHWRRRLARGFNQSALIAEALSRRIGVPCARRALVRVRPTPAQAGLSQQQRRRNLQGALRTPRPETVRGKTVLLVDDVMTTGATLTACARTLRRAGAKEVRALVVARAQLSGRAR